MLSVHFLLLSKWKKNNKELQSIKMRGNTQRSFSSAGNVNNIVSSESKSIFHPKIIFLMRSLEWHECFLYNIYMPRLDRLHVSTSYFLTMYDVGAMWSYRYISRTSTLRQIVNINRNKWESELFWDFCWKMVLNCLDCKCLIFWMSTCFICKP